jgi:pimeloyl-ACP methyl ester carboxylesterase
MPEQNSRPALLAATRLRHLDERFAEVRAVRLRYFVGSGDGEPLVLVHGLGGAACNWSGLVDALAGRHRLLVPELPGHGGSAPLPATPNLLPFAKRVITLAEREGLLPAVLVGHSLGGLVALRAARLYPDCVLGVVLAGAAGISTTSRRAKKALLITGLVKPGRRLAPYRSMIATHPLLRRAVLRWGVADP